MNLKSTKIALEGTHIGDDLGGPCGPGESFRRFLFEKMLVNSMESQKVYRLSKRKPLKPNPRMRTARGLIDGFHPLSECTIHSRRGPVKGKSDLH